MKSNPNETAKDPRWQVPMGMPGVKPSDYKNDEGKGNNIREITPKKSMAKKKIKKNRCDYGPPEFVFKRACFVVSSLPN